MVKNFLEDIELKKLEDELEQKLIGHNKGIPFKEYIKKQQKPKDNFIERDLALEYLNDLNALQNKYKKLDKILKKTDEKAIKIFKKGTKLGLDYSKKINDKLNINDVIKQRNKKDKKALGDT